MEQQIKQELQNLHLYEAVRLGQHSEVEALLKQGAQSDGFKGKHGGTALHWAARENHPDIAKMLLEAGANPSATDHHDITPYHFAYLKAHTDLETLLLANGAKYSKPSFVQKMKMSVGGLFAHASAKSWVKAKMADLHEREENRMREQQEEDEASDDDDDDDWDDLEEELTEMEELELTDSKLLLDEDQWGSEGDVAVCEVYHNEGYRTLARCHKVEDLKKADHIAFPRKVVLTNPLYWHHGIVESVDAEKKRAHIIHFQKRRGNIKIFRDEMVMSEKSKVYVVVYNEDDCLSPDETVTTAQAKIGKQEYNVIRNNCEHMATECKTGKKCSGQVTKLWMVTAPVVSQRAAKVAVSLVAESVLEAGVIAAVKGASQRGLGAAAKAASRIGAVGIVVGTVVETLFIAWDVHKAYERLQKKEIDKETCQNIIGGRVIQGVFDVGLGLGGMVAGAAIGALAGPIGALVGSIIGGIVGGLAGRAIGYGIGKLIPFARKQIAYYTKTLELPSGVNI